MQINSQPTSSSSGFKGETEGFILAPLDQSLLTRNYQASILHYITDPKCRFCDQYIETIDHLISEFSILTSNEYKNRHDRIDQYLHWKICYRIKTTVNFFILNLQLIEQINICSPILWDFSLNTDRTMHKNCPDIIIKDRKEKGCALIDQMAKHLCLGF